MQKLITLFFILVSLSTVAQNIDELANRFTTASFPATINDQARSASPKYRIDLVDNKFIYNGLDSVCNKNYSTFNPEAKSHVVRPVYKIETSSSFYTFVLSHSNSNIDLPWDFIFLLTITPKGEIIDHMVLVQEDGNNDYKIVTTAEFESESKFKLITTTIIGTEETVSEELYEIDKNGKIKSE